MMKYLVLGMFIFATGCGVMSKKTDAELARQSILGAASGTKIISVDGNPFVSFTETTVKPGAHQLSVSTNGYGSKISCFTVEGHYYEVSSNGCKDEGLSRAAASELSKARAEELKAQIIRDKAKYQEYKFAVLTPTSNESPSESTLRQIKRDLDSKRGGFKDDPDNLLEKVNKLLAPYFESERKHQQAVAEENARLQALREKADAEYRVRLAKEQEVRDKADALRIAEEKKRVITFRKSIKEGDETNCGPILETKAKLIKVAFAVANYGTEHWIRRDQIYPKNYGCRFLNGVYQEPNF